MLDIIKVARWYLKNYIRPIKNMEKLPVLNIFVATNSFFKKGLCDRKFWKLTNMKEQFIIMIGMYNKRSLLITQLVITKGIDIPCIFKTITISFKKLDINLELLA